MTRKDQREQTQARLLDATIECLVAHGYAGTTTQRIQDAAGVSRGALLHHFNTKSELLVAAIHHIADKRLEAFSALTEEFDVGPGTLEQLVAAIRTVMGGGPFQAAIELWAASRTDEELRAALLPAERRLGAALHDIFNEHSGIADPGDARVAFESLMALVRGLELTRIMRDDQQVADMVIGRWLEDARRLR